VKPRSSTNARTVDPNIGSSAHCGVGCACHSAAADPASAWCGNVSSDRAIASADVGWRVPGPGS
jgi:hypothetical protein